MDERDELHVENSRKDETEQLCIICLYTLKPEDAIWSCQQCFCAFHLTCVQAWAKDSVHTLHSHLSVQLFPEQVRTWSCPKCRKDYQKVPEVYHCFCGKKIDPPFDPWIVPHSCGEVCGRKTACSHPCSTLCHPGTCPPCPKTLSLTCYCGKSAPRMKRCGSGGWSCGAVCGQELACGLHTCEQSCHEGECGPCSELIFQSCQCGRRSKERPCSDTVWSCQEPCLKLLACGHHYCQKVCHTGECGDCLLTLPRHCPCGKTQHQLPCTEETPLCKESCHKLLACGLHHCTRLCHHGNCGSCHQVVRKPCRCGKRTKEVVCSQEFLCESKCQRLRNCQIHLCKRKCCSGQCPPCEQLCLKLLACRNHKCQAPCHPGRCYPCSRGVEISCYCGSSKITVPCGQERKVRPPSCPKLCSLPRPCGHMTPHPCHFPPCPPCTLTCGRQLPCGHSCQALCHSTPRLKSRPPGLAPWIKMNEMVTDPCPPCHQKIEVVCVGDHTTEIQLCAERRVWSCENVCGRLLACGNHKCTRGCHKVLDPPGEGLAGSDCLECERGCEKPRPPGCAHICSLPCHKGQCPPCPVRVKVPCHCRTLTLFIKCHEWVSSANQDQLQSCSGQCSRKLPCGHRCPQICHSGLCTAQCSKKVTVRCKCGHIKKESKCSDQLSIVCNHTCQQFADEKHQALLTINEHAQCEQEKAQIKARLDLQRQLQPRKRRRKLRQQVMQTTPEKSTSTFWRVGLLTLALLSLAGLCWTLAKVYNF